MKVYSHFIDGVFTDPSNQTIASVDPSTGYQGVHGRRIAFNLGLEGKQIKQCVVLISSNISMALKPSLMASVQRYCSNTSKQSNNGSLVSMAVSPIAFFKAAASTSSSECVGKK